MLDYQEFIMHVKSSLAPFKAFIKRPAQGHIPYDYLVRNNKNIIKPYSNWQGPVWPIANYMYLHGLLNYGFQKEAIELAKKISNLVLGDIKTSGCMHENYDAETKTPLLYRNKAFQLFKLRFLVFG